MACVEDEIVVSGMAGRFPECNSVAEFWEALESGREIITEDDRRSDKGAMNAPTASGKIPELDRLDAAFFGLNPQQVNHMDPQARILLEVTYEAMFDAGLNPAFLRGSNTGVFLGMCFNDSESYYSSANPHQSNSAALFGNARSLLANRISYAFDLTGPSVAMDTACSSGLYALAAALSSLRSGGCTAAIVAGTNILLNPLVSVALQSMGAISTDGRCRSFDAAASGYVRSEAVVVLLLQAASVAKRHYGTVVHVATNCDGFKPQNIAHPSVRLQGRLLEAAYREAKVPLDLVDYVEAHGTGTRVGDPVELRAVTKVFCMHRTTPLLIGSVKSNMGHAEGASGLCSIVKVLLAMKYDKIPANMHFETPNPHIPSLLDGRLQVVSKNQPLTGDYVGVNGFGFGGANAHAIIRRPRKQVIRTMDGPNRGLALPWIVGVSGRTEKAVQILLDQIKKDPGNSDVIALLHAFFAVNIPGHLYRGAIVVTPDKTNATETIQKCQVDKAKPIWYVFSGFGGQWPTMCRELLDIPTFRASIDECNEALKPVNFNIFDILNNPNEDTLNEFTNGFVAWVAIQIALVDLLTLMGIKPDGIIGHSIGEIASAYADGCLTAQQAVLVAYYRGKVFSRPEFAGGAMAAVGLSAEKMEKMLPPGIDIGCDNGRNLVTLSGPAEELRSFIESLRQQDIYVKEVNVNGVAFHSRHIASAGQILKPLLSLVIPEPKPRSKRWISSSVDREHWHSEPGELCSPEYFVNNQMTRVRFRSACAEIPAGAVVVELAPHAMLQGVLKDMLQPTTSCMPLLRKNESDIESLVIAVGKLYVCGAQPVLAALYPRAKFPVQASTPLLSSLVAWDHTKQWVVPRFVDKAVQERRGCRFVVDLSREEDAWYAGHQVDGRVIFPATGLLVFVWKALGTLYNVKYDELHVTFQDVCFLQATLLPPSGEVELVVQLLGTGRIRFEVTEGDRVVCSGAVLAEKPSTVATRTTTTTATTTTTTSEHQNCTGHVLASHDVYKDLLLRGYQYSGAFKGVLEVSRDRAVIAAAGNWVTLLDSMLQVRLFDENLSARCLVLPTRIRRVVIDPLSLDQKDGHVHVIVDSVLNIVECPGVTIAGVSTATIERRPDISRPLLEEMTFTPYHSSTPMETIAALMLAVQLVMENTSFSLEAIQVAVFSEDVELTKEVAECFRKIPGIKAELSHVAENVDEEIETMLGKAQVKVASKGTDCRIAVTKQIDEKVSKSVRKGGFVLLLSKSYEVANNFKVLSSSALTSKDNLLLCVKLADEEIVNSDNDNKDTSDAANDEVVSQMIVVRLELEAKFDWLSELQGVLSEGIADIVLVAEGNDNSGIVGLVNCLRLESTGHRIRCVFIQDPTAAKFSLTEPFYAEQLALGLTANVYKGGRWGSYRHIPLPLTPRILVDSAYVNTKLAGDLSSLCWVQGQQLQELPTEGSSVLCHIYYSGLNFHDVMLASGQLSLDSLPQHLANEDCVLGLEFSGRDCTGRRVMGIVPSRGLATTVLAQSVWEVPDDWTLEQAATVPVVYCTAYYALLMRGHMQNGESILIHAGSGGVGQAAITLALHMGCTVFTTVGSAEKRAFLKDKFPQLDDEHIGDSRSTSFEQLVMTVTQGRGVDLVLNSLTGDKLLASVRCLALHGRFVEIGQFDLQADQPLGMAVFLKNVSYLGVRLDVLFGTTEHEDCAEIVSLVREGVASGVVQPLTFTTFASDQVEQAFRFMAAGKHIGKVVVRVRDEEKARYGRSLTVPPSPHSILATLRYNVPPNSVCIVTGGLGGFGLELTNWLVMRGARHLVLCSRTGDVSSGYKALCVRRWERVGARIVVSTADITTRQGVEELLDQASQMGPVSAIFHLAVVLADRSLVQQNQDSFGLVWKIKMAALENLDLVSRTHCLSLEKFVLFSSAASGRGNPGQSNYAMANSAAERLIEARRAAGYPGLAIQWGPIGEVGLAADMKFDKMAAAAGIQHQSVRSCLAVMDQFLITELSVVASMVVVKQSATSDGGQEAILEAIANVLGLDKLSEMPPDTKLVEVGMDSLMQVEIRMALELYRGVTLSPTETRQLTVGRLLELASDEGSKQRIGVREKMESEPPNVNSKFMDTILLGLSWNTLMPEDTLVCLESACDRLPPIFMVHPIDGSCASLSGLARLINRTVYGLQFTKEAPQTTVPDLAAFYIKHVRSQQAEGPYLLVGYSFGAMIAVEMAYQLESKGYCTTLVSLDGLPQYKHLFTDLSRDDVEVGFLLRLAEQRLPEVDLKELRRSLLSVTDWPSRLSLCIQRGAVTGTKGDAMRPISAGELDSINAWRWKCLTIQDHALPLDRVSLPHNVVVVAARRGTVHNNRGDESYGFQQICQQKVQVLNVDGDHVTFLVGNKHLAAVAGHINTFLQQ